MKSFKISIGKVEYDKDSNIHITFDKGGSADYELSKAELERFKDNPKGSYYNKNIRIKKTPF